MSSISLSIQNPGTTPADAPYLYLRQANTLNLLFTSNMGVSTLNPGDKFTLILPANLLAAPSAENLNSPDWQLISAQSNGSSYLVELSPQASLSFKTPLTISFQNLQASVIGMGDVSTRYLIGGRPVSGSSAKLSVINPPSQPKNLPDAIRFGVLFNDEQDIISNEQLALSPNTLQPPIANRIHVNFTFNGDYLVGGYYQLDYFKPDISTYQALGQNNWAPVPTKNIAYNYLDVEALAITPDGKRVFVADHANSKIWYFDTDNIPATFAQGIAQVGIKALAMTKNGWLYAANLDTVYALDTAAENYTFASSFALSEFNLIFNLTASVDNSFVLFSRTDNLHILSGVRTGYSTLTLLQSINISDFLNVAIVPDNTQIYVAKFNVIEVLGVAGNLV